MTTLKALALSALAIFAPVKPLMLAALFLVVVDTITGLLAARKKGEAVTSAKLRRSVSKALVYSAGLMAGHVTGIYLIDQDWVAKLVAGAIGVTEMLSIAENLSHFSGGGVLKSLVTKLGSPNEPSKPPADKP